MTSDKEKLIQLDNFIATTILGKWCLDILSAISVLTTVRFEDLRKNLSGITGKVLSRKLRFLESKGLVERHVVVDWTPLE